MLYVAVEENVLKEKEYFITYKLCVSLGIVYYVLYSLNGLEVRHVTSTQRKNFCLLIWILHAKIGLIMAMKFFLEILDSNQIQEGIYMFIEQQQITLLHVFLYKDKNIFIDKGNN
ncbi:hypothetical protein ACJX0J_027009, partial [Zea mays]